MITPDIKDLMRNMDSRYTLVVTAAKRARQLTDGAKPLTRFHSDKPVTLAIHEIAEGKIDYFRDDGIYGASDDEWNSGGNRRGDEAREDTYAVKRDDRQQEEQSDTSDDNNSEASLEPV